MKTRNLFILIILAVFFCCNNVNDSQIIQNEVNALNTIEKQAAFLQEIYNLDQKVRTFSNEQEMKFGFESNEHKEAGRAMMNADKINLAKIEAYLNTYGHPKKDLHGKDACLAPWIVIHHTFRADVDKTLFKYLYRGYQHRDLDVDKLNFFLNRVYYEKFDGQRIEWDRTYRSEEELDTLLNRLDLIDIVNEVLLEKMSTKQKINE